MLSRPATKITLTPDDVLAYEQRKQARDAMQHQQDLDGSQSSSEKSTVENEHGGREEDGVPAASTQTRAARVKQAREQRIGETGRGDLEALTADSRHISASLLACHGLRTFRRPAQTLRSASRLGSSLSGSDSTELNEDCSRLCLCSQQLVKMAYLRNKMSSLVLCLAALTTLLTVSNADLQVPGFGGSADSLLSPPLDLGAELESSKEFTRPEVQLLADLGAQEQPPDNHHHVKRYGSGTPYWFSQIKRQGKTPYGVNDTFVIFRNVRDYGAKGDGITDDTDAFNNATFDGDRCVLGCDSRTTQPVIVWIPSGTYKISRPIIQTYYTQFIGDANNLPVLQGTSDFFGIGIVDSDPYLAYGYSWWANQNNFWRQIRNVVFDMTQMPASGGMHGLHWQVAQGTSLQNIVFKMRPTTWGDDNDQIGIFMDNGSALFMEDVIFIGGSIGFFAGNQQYTVRNFTFNGCKTGIFQNWNWVFLYKELHFNDVGIPLDIRQGGDVPATGSIVMQDCVVTNALYGIVTTFSANSTPSAAGSLVLDNVNFVNSPVGVQFPNDTVIVPGNRLVESFVQGTAYTAYEHMEVQNGLECWVPTANYSRIQREAAPPVKPASLLTPTGTIYTRSRPQYEGVPVASFVSIMDYGCKGDGVSDDTVCLQNFLNSIKQGQIAYFDHGAYIVRNTIQVPNNIKIQGEIWPLIMFDGSSSVWQDINNPVPGWRVGNPGDVGTTEIVEIIFETRGSTPGLIVTEWNLAGTYPGATGMFDTHWRIGGTNGTLLQNTNCKKTPGKAHGAAQGCFAAFLLVHITSSASNTIMCNNWGWVADHELDIVPNDQIDIYNGRGILVESQGPMWLVGTSFEHSVLYNYNIANARDIYIGAGQSETAYMQNNPNALTPFTPRAEWSDPTFSECYQSICPKTFALRFFNTTYSLIYGAGFYSFFNNYDSGCLLTRNCQSLMVSLELSEAIYIYGLSTVAAENMIEVDMVALVPQAYNTNSFASSVSLFEYP